MDKLVIGVDFGSDSARATLVRTDDGATVRTAACPYRRWAAGLYSSAVETRFRQHPLDYGEALKSVLHGVLDGFAEKPDVVGVGVDTTASTPCLTDAAGVPLALRPEFAEEPDAMFVLWKDHTGTAESREITAAANVGKVKYARQCGNDYSAESGWSKVAHILRTNPRVAAAAASVVEQCDYVTGLLTGGAAPRSRCAAAYKWMWSEAWGGYPPAAFFRALGGDRLAAIRDSLPTATAYASARAGTLSADWARELGLSGEVAVSVGNVDAHSGTVGAGGNLGTAVLTLGTSGCLMAMMPQEAFAGRFVADVFGQVPGGIVEGLEGFELGQSAFGDCYAWLKRLVVEPMRELLGGTVPEEPLAAAEARVLPTLERRAAALAVDDALPLATDWFNGRRSPAPDPAACATLTGLRLGTGVAEIYWALVEATAFGVRAMIDHLERNGVRADCWNVIGGIARKSPFVVQMVADVTGKAITVPELDEACALGAAMHAAVAAGVHPDVAAAQRAMGAKVAAVFSPRPDRNHDRRYARYREALARG